MKDSEVYALLVRTIEAICDRHCHASLCYSKDCPADKLRQDFEEKRDEALKIERVGGAYHDS